MRIEYKSVAQRDLLETKNYIETVLKNSAAAQKLTASILRSVSRLASHPNMGAKLSSRFDVETDIRFLVVAKQIVFYRVMEEKIVILRIIDGRRDYLSILFD